MQRIILISCFLMLPGCASYLNVYRSSDGAKIQGIPYFAPELVTVEKTTSYEPLPQYANTKNADYCMNDKKEVEKRVLPVGAKHYIDFNPAAFGKSAFAVEFSANGALSKASLNSDGTEAIGKTADLLSTVLPYVAMTKEASVAIQTQSVVIDIAADKARSVYCTTKSIVERIVE